MYKQSAALIDILKGMSTANSAEQSHKPSPDNSTEAVPSTEGKIQETLILADRQIGKKLTKDGVQPHPSSSHEAGCSKVKSPVRPKKINNMFLRHFFLENDAGGRLFIFIFFE